MVCRLIQHQAFRLLRQRTRQNYTLLLTAAQGSKAAFFEVRQTYSRQRFACDAVIVEIITLQHFLVRRTSHQHNLQHRKIKAVNIVLCHYRQLQR